MSIHGQVTLTQQFCGVCRVSSRLRERPIPRVTPLYWWSKKACCHSPILLLGDERTKPAMGRIRSTVRHSPGIIALKAAFVGCWSGRDGPSRRARPTPHDCIARSGVEGCERGACLNQDDRCTLSASKFRLRQPGWGSLLCTIPRLPAIDKWSSPCTSGFRLAALFCAKLLVRRANC
jgi:hypothetical protein